MNELILLFEVFVISALLGFEIIRKIPPSLHTPLMSGSNAISGIIIIGAILSSGENSRIISFVLGFLAVFFATLNVLGGFIVTHRMLNMFRKGRKYE